MAVIKVERKFDEARCVHRLDMNFKTGPPLHKLAKHLFNKRKIKKRLLFTTLYL